MLHRTAVVLLASLLPVATFACAVYTPPVCLVGADCASGICDADGTCGTPATGGASGSSSTHASGSGAGNGSGGGGSCQPNNDGVITRQEVPLQPGLHAKFLAAEDAGVNTTGTSNTDGSTTWDLSVSYSGDHAEEVDTLPLAAQWFGKDFAGASYAARLADSSDLLGIFTLTDTELDLVGVASPAAGSTQTELHYAPAVKVLAFPLAANDTWTTTSTVTGTAEGITVYYYETYQSSIDGHGTLKTPYADFQVLRVDTLLTRVVGALVTTTRTFAFVTECFGNVASVVSNTDELTTDFTTAAEVTRLAP
jgi:hypothetical protein